MDKKERGTVMKENLTHSKFQKCKEVHFWFKFKNYGWFGMFFGNIQAEPSKEARGQN